MSALVFKNEGLRKVLDITLKGTSFSLGYNPKKSKSPTLLFVKDDGIYLMTGAVMEKFPEDYSHVCYAEGYSPDVEDVWEKCREAVGGDDFGEVIELDEKLQGIINKGHDLLITVTPESFSISYK